MNTLHMKMDFNMNAQKTLSTLELFQLDGESTLQGACHSAGSDLQLGSKEFAALFGIGVEELDECSVELIESLDFRYRKLSRNERDQIVLQIIKELYCEEITVSGEDRKQDWEKGWRENLQAFTKSGYDLDSLIPRYFKKYVPVRLNGDYVMPIGVDFVLNCTKVFRSWLFRKYLKDVESLYEFGCGPGSHLAYLAGLYPDKKLYGLDWAQSSQEILEHLANQFCWSIKGIHFDFFQPDLDFHLAQNSAVLTFGALEQVGDRFETFLQYILYQKPTLCINVECINEFYQQNNLPDFLALQYHRRRNYLSDFLTRLRQLESEQRVKILKAHHQPFGNIYNDTHSYIIWKPS